LTKGRDDQRHATQSVHAAEPGASTTGEAALAEVGRPGMNRRAIAHRVGDLVGPPRGLR
jgi:hypothetical protein